MNKEEEIKNGLKKPHKGITYKKRCELAIEYITEYRNGWNNWFEFTINDKIKLLEILKGDSNE